uniref:LysR substrate-binding domain-containing protein n=1 Tax=Piscinibacter sakaiensis TaxID=1547922 RepID=UPI00372CECE1
MAVIAGPARRPSLVSTPLTQATFAWCARPDLAARLGGTVDAAALQAHPLVGLPAGSGITQLVDDWLRRSGAQAPRRLDCNHWGAIAGLLVHRASACCRWPGPPRSAAAACWRRSTARSRSAPSTTRCTAAATT